MHQILYFLLSPTLILTDNLITPHPLPNMFTRQDQPSYTISIGCYLRPVADSLVYSSTIHVIFSFDFKTSLPDLFSNSCQNTTLSRKLCSYTSTLDTLQEHQATQLKDVASSIFAHSLPPPPTATMDPIDQQIMEAMAHQRGNLHLLQNRTRRLDVSAAANKTVAAPGRSFWLYCCSVASSGSAIAVEKTQDGTMNYFRHVRQNIIIEHN